MRLPLIALAVAFAPAGLAIATAADEAAILAPLSAAEASATVLQLADLLEANYVFPETGQRYGAMLRANLAQGRYRAAGDPKALADQVTADLRALAPDRHLRLYSPNMTTPVSQQQVSGSPPIEATRWLDDGIAYIRFSMLARDAATMAELKRFMSEHADAQVLIIDARTTRGGGLPPIDLMLSYLYAKPAKLAWMDTRAAADAAGRFPFPEGPSLRRLASHDAVVRREHGVVPHATERRLFDAHVFYLTSARTASAAEALALAFRRTGRATLVGETTRGAGHFGMIPSVGERFSAFIPIGRTYDPDTGQGWEGVGIAPDVAVPAAMALDEALRLARAVKGELSNRSPH